MKIAAHLCGSWVSAIMDGRWEFKEPFVPLKCIQRIQLNLGRDRLKKVLSTTQIWQTLYPWTQDHQIILGGNYEDTDPTTYQFNNRILPLFDASGGRGIQRGGWPSPIENTVCGYAGGIGPENVEKILQRLSNVVEDSEIWICMESGIRSNEDQSKFDPYKCTKVLEIAQPWIVQGAE